MKFYELLPVERDEIEGWTPKFLLEVHKVLAVIVNEDNPSEVRERNTRLASYLGTLNTLKSANRQKRHYARRKFIAQHPKPTEAITKWNEEVEHNTYDTKLLIEHIEGLIEAIQTNISTEQSNLKSTGREGQTS